MSNRPRREIKARNVFDEDPPTSNTPNAFNIPTANIQPNEPVTMPPPPPPPPPVRVHPPPTPPPPRQITKTNNDTQPNKAQNVKVEVVEQEKKKSKIEELKQKYLKKTADSKPAPPVAQTKFQPITLKYTVSLDGKTENSGDKTTMSQSTIVVSKPMYQNPYATEPVSSPHHNFTEPPSPNPFEGLFGRQIPTSILETKASGRQQIDCKPLLLCTQVSSPTPVVSKPIVRPPPPPIGPVKVSRRNINLHGHSNDEIKEKISQEESPRPQQQPNCARLIQQKHDEIVDQSAYSPATNPAANTAQVQPPTRQSPTNRVINPVNKSPPHQQPYRQPHQQPPHHPQPPPYQQSPHQHTSPIIQKPSARIKHTVSINRSMSPEQTDTTDIQPIPITSIHQNINQLDLLNNTSKLVQDIRRSQMIDQHVYEQILKVLSGSTHPIYSNEKVSFVMDNPNFQFNQQQSSYQWLVSFFDNFALVASTIDPQCYALTYHFITSVFNTQAILCQAFFVSLVKLDQNYYYKHLDELLRNIGHYLYVLRKHGNCINSEKLKHFVKFLLGNLSRLYASDNYCRIFIDIAYEYPEIVLADDEAITQFFRHSSRFGYVALFYLLMKAFPTKTQIKSLASCINSIVRHFEEKGYKQEILTILQSCSVFGPNAYRMLREIRGRVVQKMDSQEGKKDGITAVFGGLLKTFDFINSKVEKNEPVKAQEPEEKEDIKWDPVKKRYVLKGEIPEDEEQTQEKANVPLPPVPPPPSRNTDQDRPSIPTQDRPVGVVPPPKKGRLPPNRYVQ